MRHGLGFNECSTSNNAPKTIFVKSSSPPQISSVDVAKPKGKPQGKPKGQALKKHHTRQKAMSKRTSSPNIHCYYCMKRGHINVF